ncbi:VOC family protein [Methylocystis sp. Sn-Cys]|uniref:VOC family protein n=1 Tax=Methylocystis sp. Sn-Cys TaxID=1701263 RepID=UPI00192350E1|nr:VOC family protein [Methylocystis sp. Sn-Cys]MBL1256924.1 lactoylglutathione lyase [Methylocystis sp. Sn-Cys]
MSSEANLGPTPNRILYTMLRVADLDRSVRFYRDALGMREFRRETFSEGRFTLAFMGYHSRSAMIELTCNWDQTSYRHGTGYGHVALEVADLCAACERLTGMGVKILRLPGPMTFAVDETGARENVAFIEDPDGYRIELIEAA